MDHKEYRLYLTTKEFQLLVDLVQDHIGRIESEGADYRHTHWQDSNNTLAHLKAERDGLGAPITESID